MIQIFSNSLGDEELKAVSDVFESKWIGAGEITAKFESEFAKKIGSKYALLHDSATSTLFSSIEMLDIQKGDEVIIPSINFVGCSNAVLKVGAKPVFCDVDPYYFTLLPEEIEAKSTDMTKAVMLLHYGGHPVDFGAISKKCTSVRIIEDSANSILSKYNGRNCGTLGDIGCFSFDAMKFISIGNGGAMAVQDEELYKRAVENRYYGLPPKGKSGIDKMAEGNERWWEIELNRISGRHISNDIQASIAREQLKKVDSFIERRKEVWKMYKEGLEKVPWLQLPPEPRSGTESSYYMFWLKIKNNRDKFAHHMIKNGVYVTFRYFPLHLIQYYRKNFGIDVSLPNAEEINRTAINIPLHQNLSDDDVQYVIKKIAEFGNGG